MIARLYILLIFLFLLPLGSVAQESPARVVTDIEFEGLKRSKEAYIRSNLLTKEGEIASDSLLEADVQRLKNLVSISNANYRKEDTDTTHTVIFSVDEVRTLLPILNAGGIEDNFFLQVGFADINWAGKGQQLSAVYQNTDRRHSGNIFYKVPRINNGNWGISSSASRFASREPLFFNEGTVIYNYNNDGVSLSGIKHLNYFQYIEFGGTYFVERYEKIENLNEVQAPDFLVQPKWLGKFVFTHNKLNYDLFYLTGVNWTSNVTSVLNTLDNTLFLSFQFQAVMFKRTGRKGNWANRLRLGLASNNDSPFAPFVVDSHVNIRGVGNRIDRGTAQIIINSEYRHTLKEKKKWGFQSVIFSDLGTWRNPGGELKDLINPDQFRWFVGAGFRIIYHKIYGATLRIDYGLDLFKSSQRGFVIGLGQY